jgi:uncharacterized DUF497 family protein
VDNKIKYQTGGLSFTWDDAKNRENIKKHEGITFKVATEVFCDPHVVASNPYRRNREWRWDVIGRPTPNSENILFVVVTERITAGDLEVIRIISARYASVYEEELYYVEQGID